jgi:hypothetical protein
MKLAKPYNQYQSYKAGEYITFDGLNYYICLIDADKQQSPRTASTKWQQVFNSSGLTPSGVTAGTYGDATHVGQFTVDVNGIITSAADVLITAGLTTLTIGTTTITSGTTTRILYDNAGILGEYTITGSGTVVAMATSPTFGTSITGSYLTASEILITDGSKNIVSAPVATYPSLTELTYVKGVTSAIQSQLNNLKKGSFGATWNGQGGVVANSNTAIVEVTIPYAGTITDWNVESYYTVAGVPTALAGTIVFDIYRSGASIIGAGNKPTLTAASTASAAVSGWTSTALAVDDKLFIYIVGTPVTSLVVSVTIKTTKS